MKKDILAKLLEQLTHAIATGTPETDEVLARSLAEALGILGRTDLVAPAADDDLNRALQIIEDAWFHGASPPEELPGSPGHQARLSKLVDEVLAVQRFAISMSKGDLSPSLKVKGLSAGGLKALQANLRHLTWQTQMIAKGDFTQRVDFMGEFSQSFNSMVENLAASHDQLKRHGAELLQANASLREAYEDMEAFSYSVSHDLRAPLRAIEGFSRMVVAEHAGQLDAEGLRLLTVISDNARLMARLIDDLLGFSRLGRQKVKKSNIDMTRLTDRICEELKGYPPASRLSLTLKKLPPAYGDLPLVKQVLINLLSNAFKFSAPREIAEIEVGGWSADNQTVYYVKDNGIGFDMQHADKIFGVFERLHRKSEFEGTGVGLAVVQKIVQRHGGRVWAEGKVNEGATFYFSLPKAAE